jgi:heterodisulfide reductase subunit B
VEYGYYPGCTLSTQARAYDSSGQAVAAALGIRMVELPDWQCCGATFPLAVDDTLALVAPTRVLCQAREVGEQVAVLCAICFHVLRRCQALLSRDAEMLDRINWYIEQDYVGDLRVAHFLEVLRDEIGWETIAKAVVRPLTGLRVAPYYGCLLLRPFDEIGLDDPEDPSILHDLIVTLGAEVAPFPFSVECCGSYLIAKEPHVPSMLAREILDSAREARADVLITACPLCQFNLDYPQGAKESAPPGSATPVLYFTQLMAVALGLSEDVCGFEGHYVDPRVLLASLPAEQELA